jgi:transposase
MEERRVYQASTGGSMQEVANTAGVSHQTVANYWKRWAAASPAIIEATPVKGRYRRIFDLAEVDMAVEA